MGITIRFHFFLAIDYVCWCEPTDGLWLNYWSVKTLTKKKGIEVETTNDQIIQLWAETNIFFIQSKTKSEKRNIAEFDGAMMMRNELKSESEVGLLPFLCWPSWESEWVSGVDWGQDKTIESQANGGWVGGQTRTESLKRRRRRRRMRRPTIRSQREGAECLLRSCGQPDIYIHPLLFQWAIRSSPCVSLLLLLA